MIVETRYFGTLLTAPGMYVLDAQLPASAIIRGLVIEGINMSLMTETLEQNENVTRHFVYVVGNANYAQIWDPSHAIFHAPDDIELIYVLTRNCIFDTTPQYKPDVQVTPGNADYEIQLVDYNSTAQPPRPIVRNVTSWNAHVQNGEHRHSYASITLVLYEWRIKAPTVKSSTLDL